MNEVNPSTDPKAAVTRVLWRAALVGTALYLLGNKKTFVQNAILTSVAAELFLLTYPLLYEKVHGKAENA